MFDIFFFKQKTAYEMRISDWSSDVCSSDLLANAMLVAENDSLKIIASDMEIEAQETIATTVIEPGKTTVSASTFYDIVRKLPDGSTVELNLDGGHLELKAARSRFRLPVLSPAAFPLINAGDLHTASAMPAKNHRQIKL